MASEVGYRLLESRILDCLIWYLSLSIGVRSEVQAALTTTLTHILTPKSSTDLLLSIRSKLSSATASTSSAGRAPYSITFVGVNGVGKSTNLSKVCFWLVQNGLRVLIAACDTFRSGAVEQLRVHVRNLGMLSAKEGSLEQPMVELYERGYGKDAAGIARDAISYGKSMTCFKTVTHPSAVQQKMLDLTLS